MRLNLFIFYFTKRYIWNEMQNVYVYMQTNTW